MLSAEYVMCLYDKCHNTLFQYDLHHNTQYRYGECHYIEFHYLIVAMPNVRMPGIIMHECRGIVLWDMTYLNGHVPQFFYFLTFRK